MTVRCPTCGRSVEIRNLDDLPSFPFCTDRCRLVDLGRWIDGEHAIPGGAPTGGDDDATEGEDARDPDAD